MLGQGCLLSPQADEEMLVPLFANVVAARTRRTILQDYEELGSPCCHWCGGKDKKDQPSQKMKKCVA